MNVAVLERTQLAAFPAGESKQRCKRSLPSRMVTAPGHFDGYLGFTVRSRGDRRLDVRFLRGGGKQFGVERQEVAVGLVEQGAAVDERIERV